jgi:UDP-glucuronate 4-epimerase
MDFIEAIEKALGKKAKKNFLPMQEGDVPATWADVADLEKVFGYKPKAEIQEGINEFISWFRHFYKS